MKIVAAAGAVAFVAAAGFYLLFGSWGANFQPLVFYAYLLQPDAQGSGMVADFVSVFASFLFVFVCGLFFYGWLGVAAMAAEATKYSSFFLTQRLQATEFLFALPQLLALTSASLVCEAVSENGAERRKLLLHSGLFFAGGLALLLAVYHLTRA